MAASKKTIGMQDIAGFAEASAQVLAQVRQILLPPDGPKKPPTFALSQLQPSFGVTMTTMHRRLESEGIKQPQGPLNRKKFQLTLEQARSLYQKYLSERMRPEGQKGLVITVGNFKGGSTKTSTSATLAQGLSMRGHNVLVVDTDPQGSLTTLFGLLPETEVERKNTILPVCAKESGSILDAAVKTYWDGAFLVPAAPLIFEAEHELAPERQNGGQFWRVLDKGLDEARDMFDVIIIDTPPTLSYVTINAYWASDALVVPLPPSALDFASSSQFWSLFRDMCGSPGQEEKEFEFVSLLPSRVDTSDSTTELVMDWMKRAYGDCVCPVSIPKTTVTSGSAAEMGTIYDVDKYHGNRKTYMRAKEPYDQFIDFIENKIIETWAARKQKDAEERLEAMNNMKVQRA